MRGRPLLELVLFVCLWGALAIPIWRLTHATQGAVPESVAGADDARTGEGAVHSWVTLRCGQAPLSVRLCSGTNVLRAAAAPIPARWETDVGMPVQAGRSTLRLEVAWAPSAMENVAELTVTPDGFPAQRRHAWGREVLDETWEFTWQP